MQTFRRRRAPSDPKELPAHVDKMGDDIEKASNTPDNSKPMVYLAAAPAKPQNGIYFSAAGVLGTSRGMYRYDDSVPGYVFIA